MVVRELFYICESERKFNIDSHNFYIKEAQKRLISQFDDLDQEIEMYSEKWLEEVDQYFDPERHDPSDFYESAYDEGINYGMLLSEMRHQTMFSVIAGMYHQWDKVLREWLVRDARYWGGDNVFYKIWKVDIWFIFDLFERMGWKIRQEAFFNKLNACRMIVNIYKHGNGDSLNNLREKYPEYFFDYNDEDFDKDNWYDHTSVCLRDENFAEFSHSILEFWKKIPERFFNSDDLIAPDWLNEALEADRQGKKLKR
ncbi:hypothetical protein [Acinetobacter radioresistens]|uniref:hypothetical protein n=1 Tax=Acinetobacter radioresistens TaxID=40216 RepID=UPI000E7516C2|nr:hypothetical protein [Acinetobacter radioresistens]RJL71424.1 hypothetical protein D5055_07165 [Acinetobacter radioresistens]